MFVAIFESQFGDAPAVLHYELEQVSKTDILRKLKQRFGPRPFATCFARWLTESLMPDSSVAPEVEKRYCRNFKRERARYICGADA